MRGPDVNSASRPNACPFVAFDDDRDRRAEAPDPRHRCFAVPNPEPRAIAHQAAYCLTPNFPSCAFFMDWAARAAAAPLAGSAPAYGYGPTGGHESPGVVDPGGRPWAAPPPWVADPELRGTTQDAGQGYAGQGYTGQGYAPYGQPAQYVPPVPSPPSAPYVPPAAYVPPAPYVPPTPSAPPAPYVPPAPAQPSQPPSYTGEPEQLTALPEPDEPEFDRDYDLLGESDARAAAREPASGEFPYDHRTDPDDEMPAFVLPPTEVPRTVVPPIAAPAPAMPTPAVRPPTMYAPAGPESWSNPGTPYGSAPDDMDATPPVPEQRSRLTGRPIGAAAAPRLDPQARKPVKKRSDSEWSKPRRFEAYPTLGGRMRLGGLSPVLVGAFVIAIAALLLFLLPGFLGGGANGPAASRTPAVTASVLPTATPEPTPQSYTVKGGDVLSTIAKGLGRTVDQIVCFNDLKNPDRLSIGQVLLIPPADYVCEAKPTPTKR